ncbi:hypothetical protein ABK040_006727 [Willaertia magna]
MSTQTTDLKGQHDMKPKQFPGESKQESQPGTEHKMKPEPQYDDKEYYKGSDKLLDKVAIITGGDSGIGRSAAILFAREGCDVAIVYFSNDEDAQLTKKLIEEEGRRCKIIKGDVRSSEFCKKAIDDTVKELGKLDILVNNAAVQYVQEDISDISDEQIENTFRTNIFGYMYMAREALKYIPSGGSIINTTSVTSFKGKSILMDYSATKGAITAFTRSLALSVADKGIRVNAVAPGPIWTPLIPSTFSPEQIENFGKNTPLGRAGQPFECGTCYVFLASKDSSYITGQVIHVNGGEIVGG